MTTGAIRAGKAYVELSLQDKQLGSGLASAQAKFLRFANAITSIQASVAAGIGATAAAVAGVTKAVNGYAEEVTRVGTVAERVGTTVEAISKLEFAAKKSGVSVETMNEGLQEMNQRLGEAATDKSGAAFDMLTKLGLSADDLLKMKPEEALGKIADAVNKLPTKGEKQFAFDEIFGGDSREMLKLLYKGSEGIKDLGEQAQQAGAVVTELDAEKVKAFNAAWNDLKEVLARIQKAVGTGFIDMFTSGLQGVAYVLDTIFDIIDAVIATVKDFISYFSDADEEAAGLNEEVGKSKDAIDEMKKNMQQHAAATKTATTAQKDLNKELNLSFKKPLDDAGEYIQKLHQIKKERSESLRNLDSADKVIGQLTQLDPKAGDALRSKRAQGQFGRTAGGDSTGLSMAETVIEGRKQIEAIWDQIEKDERDKFTGVDEDIKKLIEDARIASGAITEFDLKLENLKSLKDDAGKPLVSDEEIARLTKANKQLEALLKMEEDAEKLREQRTEDKAAAQSIIDQNMTPQEEFQKGLADAKRLLSKGLLPQDAFDREAKRLKGVLDSELEKDIGKVQQTAPSAAAMERGSTEAIDTILSSNLMGMQTPDKKLQDNTAKTATASVKAEEHLRKMLRELRERPVSALNIN